MPVTSQLGFPVQVIVLPLLEKGVAHQEGCAGQSTLDDEGWAESKIYSMFLCNYACFLRERGRSLKSLDPETLNPALAMGRDGGAIFRI